jgi:hypothetical protein
VEGSVTQEAGLAAAEVTDSRAEGSVKEVLPE